MFAPIDISFPHASPHSASSPADSASPLGPCARHDRPLPISCQRRLHVPKQRKREEPVPRRARARKALLTLRSSPHQTTDDGASDEDEGGDEDEGTAKDRDKSKDKDTNIPDLLADLHSLNARHKSYLSQLSSQALLESRVDARMSLLENRVDEWWDNLRDCRKQIDRVEPEPVNCVEQGWEAGTGGSDPSMLLLLVGQKQASTVEDEDEGEDQEGKKCDREVEMLEKLYEEYSQDLCKELDAIRAQGLCRDDCGRRSITPPSSASHSASASASGSVLVPASFSGLRRLYGNGLPYEYHQLSSGEFGIEEDEDGYKEEEQGVDVDEHGYDYDYEYGDEGDMSDFYVYNGDADDGSSEEEREGEDSEDKSGGRHSVSWVASSTERGRCRGREGGDCEEEKEEVKEEVKEGLEFDEAVFVPRFRYASEDEVEGGGEGGVRVGEGDER